MENKYSIIIISNIKTEVFIMCISGISSKNGFSEKVYHRSLKCFQNVEDRIQQIDEENIQALLSNIFHSSGMLCIEFLYDPYNENLSSDENYLRKYASEMNDKNLLGLMRVIGSYLLSKYLYEENDKIKLSERILLEKSFFNSFLCSYVDINNYYAMTKTFHKDMEKVCSCFLARQIRENTMNQHPMHKDFVDLIEQYSDRVYHEVFLEM